MISTKSYHQHHAQFKFGDNIGQLRSGAAGLKASQTYPPGYGTHMAKLHKKYTVVFSGSKGHCYSYIYIYIYAM